MYYLMHKDSKILQFCTTDTTSQIITIFNTTMLPAIINANTTSSLDNWLVARSVDIHRTNSRLLAKMLRLKQNNIIQNVLLAHASSLTDNYWVKSGNNPMTYSDLIHARRDNLSDIALYGAFDFDLYNKILPQETPELTLGGSYEKCWKYDTYNNRWYMVKRGTPVETFNELLASDLAIYLGFDNVKYAMYMNNPNYVQCYNFMPMDNNVPTYNYEPFMFYVSGREDDQDFQLNIDTLQCISQNNKKLEYRLLNSYYNMLIFDAIILNFDRHTENYGIFKDTHNNSVVKMSPLFDHNLSLLSNNMNKITTGDQFIINEYIPIIKQLIQQYNFNLPVINYTDLQSIVQENWNRVFHDVPAYALPKQSSQFTVDFIYNKYILLLNQLT